MSTVQASKQQVPIPLDVWREAHLEEGMPLEVRALPDGTILLIPRRQSLKEMSTSWPRVARHATLEEMDEAIESCSEE